MQILFQKICKLIIVAYNNIQGSKVKNTIIPIFFLPKNSCTGINNLGTIAAICWINDIKTRIIVEIYNIK